MRITIKEGFDTGEDLVILVEPVVTRIRSDGARITVLRGTKVECAPVELAHDGELEIVSGQICSE